MALSYWHYSNCLINPEISSFQQAEKELQSEDSLSVSGFDSSGLALLDTLIDPFFQPGELLYSDGYTNILPRSSSPSESEYMISNFPPEEFEFCQQYPQRQKNFGANFFTGCVPISAAAVTEGFSPETVPVLPAFQPDMSNFNCENAKKNSQSIAARERRRKISDKTRELGKLIPGGHKMNTAEMLQAAYKYINFLQAQLGVLQSMCSIHQLDREGAMIYSQELAILLASQAIQEKLYLAEKCFVPRDFVQTQANDCHIQSSL